jgi:hypothetical protein
VTAFREAVMFEKKGIAKGIAKTPREHFMRAAEDELDKFVRKELEFRRTERNELAARLGLPLATPMGSDPSHKGRGAPARR